MSVTKRLSLLLLAVVLCALTVSCKQGQGTAESPSTENTDTTEGTNGPVTEPGINYSVAPSAPPAVARDEVNVVMSFVGDCLPGSDYGTSVAGSFNAYALANEPSYFLSDVQSVFAEDDITVVDCETVLTDSQLEPVDKGEDPGWWYYGPATNARVFSSGSVEIASVANNHTGDYGEEGFADTVAALEAEGIKVGVDMQPVYYEVKGVTVGVLCCNCWSSYHASRIRQTLEQMNQRSDIQVVFPHGGTMNTYVPDEWRRDEFRSFIDAGAEVVAAGHPHVLQPLESYGGGVIVYSLGNFCYGGSTLPENATVILSVSATFTEGEYTGLSYEVLPCYLYTTPRNNYKPELIPPTHEGYNRILEFMYGLRASPIE